MSVPPRPTRRQIAEATARPLPDLLAPGLAVMFVGINPGLYSAAIGHHFGRPGNRFWPALHLSGFTPRRYAPWEEQLLLGHRLGLTNIASRPSARADELAADELVSGAADLRQKVAELRPAFVAFLGVTAYRVGFKAPKAKLGRQPEPLEGAVAWALPSPSGLNAHFDLQGLARLFGELREAAGLPRLNVAEGTR